MYKLLLFASLFLFILICGICFSCESRDTKLRKREEKIASDSLRALAYYEHSLKTEDETQFKTDFPYSNIYRYEKITSNRYDELSKNNAKNAQLKKGDDKIEETLKGLTITLGSGEKVHFKNDDGIVSESCIQKYSYIGFHEQHSLHIYSLQLYESTEYYILNDQTGTNIHLWGKPFFLADGKKMACVSWMLGIEGGDNGIHFYNIEHERIEKTDSINLKDWIPSDLFWLSDKLLIIQNNFPYDGTTIPKSEYRIMSCKKFNNSNISTSITKEWLEDFHFYPFSKNSREVGEYQFSIWEHTGEAIFVTYIVSKDVGSEYKGYPCLINDTLFMLDKNNPIEIARITKYNNEFYLQSDLISVFSDEVKEMQYGYKLEAGYPEDYDPFSSMNN